MMEEKLKAFTINWLSSFKIPNCSKISLSIFIYTYINRSDNDHLIFFSKYLNRELICAVSKYFM